MHKTVKTVDKYVTLLELFTRLNLMEQKPVSTNDCINFLYKNDIKEGIALDKGWRYYTHLNKQTSLLEENGFIQYKGMKQGEYKEEKTFRVTNKGWRELEIELGI